MKPVLEAVSSYLTSKNIRYNVSATNSISFSLLVPTPDQKEMPNRFVSSAITIQENRIVEFSAAVMLINTLEEIPQDLSSVMFKFQSATLKVGKMSLHPDGTLFYHLSQFLCSGGTTDEEAVAAMIHAAVLEMASIFMLRDLVKVRTGTISRFGTA